MRSAKVVLTMFLLGMLFGCAEKTPPAETGQQLAAVTGPAMDEVDIEFRGLVASVFIKTGKYVQSVFLSPNGEEHKPLGSISTQWIHDSNATDPDFVTTGDDDTGLAVWEFTESSVDQSNVADLALTYDASKIDTTKPKYALLRWVPSMDDIFGDTTQQVSINEIANAAARGAWHVGALTPIFDRESHKTDKWTIGTRKATPLADGLRLRLKLKNAGNPLVLRLKLKRTGTEQQILVKGGGTILMSAYPTKLPKTGDDLKHFHHFYSLIKPSKTPPSVSGPPTPYPARCAPAIFIPDVDPI